MTLGVIHVRETKFGKSREVPLHSSTVDALIAYARHRNQFCPYTRDQAFFISTAGTRHRYCNVFLAWQGAVRDAGLQRRSTTCRPRPHDYRGALILGREPVVRSQWHLIPVAGAGTGAGHRYSPPTQHH